jgi:hypothetical protein
MEQWLLMQTFYHGLTSSARETMDAAAGGAFLSLTVTNATNLVEKMASNQSWNEDRQPPCKRGMHQLKEVDMLSAKMDLIMKKLEDRDPQPKEIMQIYDTRMTCAECGNTGHTSKNFPETMEDLNFINNNNNYRPQQQGWNQQRPNYPGNYQGNYQGNNFNSNFNQPSLRDLVINQGKTMDNLSRKIASNDKVLENINNRMDSFSSAIKNQHSFNKMIESQISQLATSVPLTTPGKIPGQPEELETANLVDAFYLGIQIQDTRERPRWTDWGMPAKKGDPGRPVITIKIGAQTFDNAICDFGASVNVMPKAIYEQIYSPELVRTNMLLMLADQSVRYTEGVLEDVCLKIGELYVAADFVILDMGRIENAPIILGRPFLATTKAIIYANTSKIVFTVNKQRERFNCKNKTLAPPVPPEPLPYPEPYNPIRERARGKNKKRRNKNKKAQPTQVMMINKVRNEYDYLIRSPMLREQDDPGTPTIHCSINQLNFYNAFCDTGSGVNLMAKVMYESIYGNMPLYPTYVQLQMADQSFRFPEGIAKDVPVKINEHYVLTDFIVMDMGDDLDPPIVLGRPFLNTTRAIIYIRTGEIHLQFPKEKVKVYFNGYNDYEQPRKCRSARCRQNKKWIQNPGEEDEEQKNMKPTTPEPAMKKTEEPSTPQKKSTKKKQWRKKKTSPSSSTESSVPPIVTTDIPWEE